MTRSRDALVRAGFMQCKTCGVITYPTDATWLEEGLLLATYPSSCEHLRALRTWLVFVDQLKRIGRRCAGTTTAGRPCRAYARRGQIYCGNHDPARRRP